MDQNNPARYLDTAYGALKSNPGATNQILQAAAQGAPVGLKGLAAAAAQQSQQQAQQAMAALQQQGPQPNVIQKLAQSGIMSQMDTGLPMAPQMGAPEEMPSQMMAGGGLVSFADGGNVLPPDVIDAIQSHFAEGGGVRGFAEGESIWEQLKNVYRPNPFDEPSLYEAEPMVGNVMSPEKAERLRDLMQAKTPSASTSFEELVAKARAEEYKNKLLGEYSAVKPSSDIEKLSASARKFNPEVAVEESPWLKGAAEEAFSFGKVGRLASKLPEGVKATGRALGKLAPYSAAFDPRVMALVKAGVGGAEMVGERAGESKTAQKLKDFMIEHGAPDLTDFTIADKLRALGLTDSGAGDVLGGLASLRENYASGGDVRGFADGALLKSLTGQSESPGMGLLNKFADLFVPEVNPAISREEFDAARAANAQKERDTATLDKLLENYPREAAPKQDVAKPTTWKPESHDGHEVVPRQRVLPEGTKVDTTFDQAKKDVPSAAVTPDSEAKGLEALSGGSLEHMRDLMMELRGHKELSPEMSQKLADLEDKARTSTIIQSILGGLAGGLSNPFGGRFALGSSAAGALGGYQKGIGSEEEISRKAFDVLRGYADAPAEEKAKAVDLLMDISKEKMKLQSAKDIAEGKGQDALFKFLLSEEGKNYRYGQGRPVNEAQLAQIQNLAEDNARKTIDAENKKRAESIPAKPLLSQEEEMNIRQREFIRQQQFIQSGGTSLGLGANINTAQSGGLGGGSPLIITRQ